MKIQNLRPNMITRGLLGTLKGSTRDRAIGRSSDRAINRAIEQLSERPSSRASDRPSERASTDNYPSATPTNPPLPSDPLKAPLVSVIYYYLVPKLTNFKKYFCNLTLILAFPDNLGPSKLLVMFFRLGVVQKSSQNMLC